MTVTQDGAGVNAALRRGARTVRLMIAVFEDERGMPPGEGFHPREAMIPG